MTIEQDPQKPKSSPTPPDFLFLYSTEFPNRCVRFIEEIVGYRREIESETKNGSSLMVASNEKNLSRVYDQIRIENPQWQGCSPDQIDKLLVNQKMETEDCLRALVAVSTSIAPLLLRQMAQTPAELDAWLFTAGGASLLLAAVFVNNGLFHWLKERPHILREKHPDIPTPLHHAHHAIREFAFALLSSFR